MGAQAQVQHAKSSRDRGRSEQEEQQLIMSAKVPWSCLYPGHAYEGTVTSSRTNGVHVILDAGYTGLIPPHLLLPSERWQLKSGSRIQAFIVGKNRDTRKLSLSLAPPEERIRALKELVADGLTPYTARVTSVTAAGVFMDMGFERQGLLRASVAEASMGKAWQELQRGQELTVHPVQVNRATGHVSLSLQPASKPVLTWRKSADGQTPYQGSVRAVMESKVLVDIGASCLASLPLSGEAFPFAAGDVVTVYVTQKSGYHMSLRVSLTPDASPRIGRADVVADGKTRYEGLIDGRLPGGHASVDFGCEDSGILRASDPYLQGKAVVLHRPVEVYVLSKGRTLELSTVPASTPRILWQDLRADGVTPYRGVVVHVTSHYTFFDIGCEVRGLLLTEQEHGDQHTLTPGEEVTVYVWFKKREKAYVSLGPRSAPGVQLEDLTVDGITPVYGTVTSVHSLGAWVDVGCEVLGLLRRQEGKAGDVAAAAAAAGVAAVLPDDLTPGATLEVYPQHRNLISRKLSLATAPAPSARVPCSKLSEGAVYDGVVQAVKYGRSLWTSAVK